MEAVPESLKNIILVMASGGFLVPPDQDSRYERLWVETWNRLDRFLPSLYTEIYPDRGRTAPASKPPEREAAIATNS